LRHFFYFMQIDINAIERSVEGVLAQESVEIVDLRYLREQSRWILRFFVDKAGGVTISDCERVSKRIGAVLDASELMTHPYALEVSSPGLNRVLKKLKDFERFAGERIALRVQTAVDGRCRFCGTLNGVEDGKVVLEHEGGKIRFEPETIREARLDPEIKI